MPAERRAAAINKAAPTLDDGSSPFFVDLGTHASAPPDLADSLVADRWPHRLRVACALRTPDNGTDSAGAAPRRADGEARRRPGRHGVQGGRPECAADIGKLRPRRDASFTVIARPGRDPHAPALPSTPVRCSLMVDVDRPKPLFARAGAPPPRLTLDTRGGGGAMLNCRTLRGVGECCGVRCCGPTLPRPCSAAALLCSGPALSRPCSAAALLCRALTPPPPGPVSPAGTRPDGPARGRRLRPGGTRDPRRMAGCELGLWDSGAPQSGGRIRVPTPCENTTRAGAATLGGRFSDSSTIPRPPRPRPSCIAGMAGPDRASLP